MYQDMDQARAGELSERPAKRSTDARRLSDACVVRRFLDRMPSAPDGNVEQELYCRLAHGIEKGVKKACPYLRGQELEDVMAEAMERALSKLRTWSMHGKLFNWCFTIGRNCALDRWKRKRNDPIYRSKSITGVDPDSDQICEEILPDPGPSEEHRVLAREFLMKWEEFMDGILPDARAVIQGIVEGRFKSITGAGNAFKMYPYEVQKLLAPVRKRLKEVLSLDQATWDAVRQLHGMVWTDTPPKSEPVSHH